MKLIYLIQSDGPSLPYRFPRGSHHLLLQWQDDYQPAPRSFHFPGSSWASGRNELHRRSRALGAYDYFVFLDDDLRLEFDLEDFEAALERLAPRRAGPFFPGHGWYGRTEAAYDRVKYVDHAFMAIRSECAGEIFPYATTYDGQCWWRGSEEFCERFWERWGLGTIRFNRLIAHNQAHRAYPRENYPGLPGNVVRPVVDGADRTSAPDKEDR